MRPRPAQVAEQFGVGAAGVLQGIGEQGEASGVERSSRELSLVVGGLCEMRYGAALPGEPHTAHGREPERRACDLLE